MRKLYEKNELNFALVWIGIYVVGMMLCDALSDALGVTKLVTLIGTGAASVFLWRWLHQEKLAGRFGLQPVQGKGKDCLWFIPLAVIGSVNLWHGVQLNLSVGESVLYAASMLLVGFLEEIIFRGFLFRAMEKDKFWPAVIVASVTFGFGHIINLLSGADLLGTLFQIIYATAIGFCFVAVFVRTGSLWPCIITHAAINSLSTFAVDAGMDWLGMAALTVVSAVYGWWLMKDWLPARKG